MYSDEPRLLLSIGNVCRQWSYLEFLLTDTIWFLSNFSREEGIENTKKLEITGLLLKAKQLAEEKSAAQLIEQFETIELRLRELRLERNRIVHGTYTFDTSKDIMWLEHHRENSPPQIINYNIINSLCLEIISISNTYNLVLQAYKSSLEI